MKYRNLGRTALRVSELCLGTMQWGWTTDEKQAWAVMDRFIEAGGNFIDTADVYSQWAPNNPGGIAEQVVGRWLKERGLRSQVVLATKVGGPMWDGPDGQGLGQSHIEKAIEDSLRRLQTEYVDLYQVHILDPSVPLEETLTALDRLVRQGKVHFVGASNYGVPDLVLARGVSRVAGIVQFETLQTYYNLIHRAGFERTIRPFCMNEGLGVMAYSPLGAGFLTGKYKRSETLVNSLRALFVQKQFCENDRAWQILDVAKEVGRSYSKSISQVALAWMLAQPGITTPVIGANSVEQLTESLGGTGFQLNFEDLQRLDEASGGTFDRNR